MGSILRRQGHSRQSVHAYSRALTLLRELLDGKGGGRVLVEKAKRSCVELLAKTLNNLGEALLALGRCDAALLRLREAYAIKVVCRVPHTYHIYAIKVVCCLPHTYHTHTTYMPSR